MKKRYYDYDALCGAMHDVVLENGAKHRCIDAGMILDLPQADVIERKKGKWIGKPIAGYTTVRCSVCRNVFCENNGRWSFCPECGADMRGEEQ